MKKIKKIFALLLAVAMVLGMTTTAFAANEDGIIGTSDDRGTITVNGIDAEEGITVTAYQIVKAEYDDNNSFKGYSVVYPNVNPAISLTPNANGEITITQENLNAIIAAEKVANTTYPMTKVADGTDYTAEVPVGSYLVVVSDAEAKVYSPMVVSVNYANENGVNVITPGTVYTIKDGNAWVKESSVPTFTKTEADAIEDTNNDFEYGNSIDVGHDVDYTLTISSVPYYGGDHPVFNVVDTLDSSLTYKADSLVVNANGNELVEGTDYTLTVNGQVITVDFVVEGEYTLNEYQTKDVVITYTATLNANAKFNENANVNTATLTFTYDSKVNSDDVKDTITEETYTYTFDLTNKLLKTGEGDDAAKLAGATFVLYTDEDCTTPYTNALDDDGEYVTNENGRLEIKGLEAGTYYLKETKAPAGYSVNTHVYKIEVVAEYQTTDEGDKDKGELVSWGIKVDDEAADSLSIPNTKLSSLPSTGGIGTTIFTIGGCAIMVAAAFFFFVSRRKEA